MFLWLDGKYEFYYCFNTYIISLLMIFSYVSYSMMYLNVFNNVSDSLLFLSIYFF